jgi:N-acetylglucosamine kinase-like BadF-type ATPase
MTVAIGVDGGGTLARAVIVDADGREISRAEAPGAVVSLRMPEAAAAAVARAVRQAADRGGVALPGAVLWAGLAGAGHEASRLAAEDALAAVGLTERVHVGTDVEAAFHAGFPDGPGLMLIAGTGSIAWARRPAGEIRRVGGWGQQLGDEGSGYAIGLAAARAVARAEDGRAGPTALRERVLGAVEVRSVSDLIPWAASASKAEVARLVPVVVECAAIGDEAARTIFAEAVSQLEAHVAALLRMSGPWSSRPGLLLSGGLIGPGGPLREALTQRLGSHAVELRPGDVDAAAGAAMLALSALRSARR